MYDGNVGLGYSPSDFVSLSRSFWPGSARLSVAMWSGDIEPTFESLAFQVNWYLCCEDRVMILQLFASLAPATGSRRTIRVSLRGCSVDV